MEKIQKYLSAAAKGILEMGDVKDIRVESKESNIYITDNDGRKFKLTGWEDKRK